MLRLCALRHRLGVEHGVDALRGAGNDELALAHVHDLCQGKRNDWRYDDLKKQVKQKLRADAVFCKQQTARNEEGENAVYRSGVEHHRSSQLLRVGDDPLFVLVDGAFELFKREHRLSEGLDDGGAPNVLDRLA